MSSIEQGARLTGTVKTITEYGLFVDLGGLDGLVHVAEVSWGRVGALSESFRVGQSIEVVVLRAAADRVSLSIKQLTEDPWSTARAKYARGTRVEAQILFLGDEELPTRVEVEPGVEGDIPWPDASTRAAVGDRVTVEVVRIDERARLLRLAQPDARGGAARG